MLHQLNEKLKHSNIPKQDISLPKDQSNLKNTFMGFLLTITIYKVLLLAAPVIKILTTILLTFKKVYITKTTRKSISIKES